MRKFARLAASALVAISATTPTVVIPVLVQGMLFLICRGIFVPLGARATCPGPQPLICREGKREGARTHLQMLDQDRGEHHAVRRSCS